MHPAVVQHHALAAVKNLQLHVQHPGNGHCALRRDDVAPADVLFPHTAQVDCGPLSGYRLLHVVSIGLDSADLGRRLFRKNMNLIVQGTGSVH